MTDLRLEPRRTAPGDPTSGAGEPSTASQLTAGSRARAVRNRLATVLMGACFVIAMVPLVWILGTVIVKGYKLLLDSEWWTQSQRGITIRTVGGGAYHALIGSLEIALLCAAIATPLGVLGAIYLVEYGGKGPLARATTFMVDILTGVPSIVAALFIYALWITLFGQQRTGLAVSLSLVLLMVPVVLRSTEEMLKLVPDELREAAYALGTPRWRTVMKVVLPTAFSGIVTGVVLGLARVMGETAPLLILGPYTKAINFDPLHGNMAALPTMINQDRTSVLQPALDRTWATALTLILLVLALNLIARTVGHFSRVRG
jgi:phosphate transport system permease protein